MADVSSLQAATHPVNAGGAFAIISGENPKYIPEVRGGHKGLEQLLNQGGFKYEATDGDYGDKIHSPVFVVHGLGRDQAMELGRRLGQESVIYSNNGQHEHIYTNGPNAGKYHPPTGEAMKVFPVRPDDGLTTRVPGLGHVRFNFDHGQLLDVPTKGSVMSEDTKKAEVSVAELKKKLADTLNKVAKSMEEFAAREVEANDDASVGDLRSSRTELNLQSPDADWIAELSKADKEKPAPKCKGKECKGCPTCKRANPPPGKRGNFFAGGSPVKKSEDACPLCGEEGACPCLLSNVGAYPKLTKSHTLAIAAAMQKIYHSYLNNVAKPQFPNDPAKQHELALAAAKDWAGRAKNPGSIYQTALGYNPDDMQATQAAVGSAHAPAAPDSMGPANEINEIQSDFKPATHIDEIQSDKYGPQMKMGKAELCKGCGKSHPLDKGCMEKEEAKFTPTPGSKTQRRKQNLTDRKRLERWGSEKDVQNFDATTRAMAEKRKGVSLQSSEAEWKAELALSEDFIDLKNANNPDKRLKNVGAETPKPAEPTKPVKGNLDEGSGGDKEKGKKLGKASMAPTSSPKLNTGLPAPGKFTQVHAPKPGTPGGPTPAPAATPKASVAPHSTVSPVAGSRSAANVRGTLYRNELEKEEMGGLAPGGGAENPAVAPLAMSQGGPPQAQPPGGNPTPSKPPMSKPKLPKLKLGKAGIPMSGTRNRMGAADAQSSAMRGGHETAPAAKPEASTKMVPKPASSYEDFMPAGKFTSAGAGLPKPAAPVVPPKPAPGSMPSVGPKLPTPGKVPGKP